MEIKENLDLSTGEFWYDLTDGGYLKPEEILVHREDIDKVMEAIRIVKEFENSCEEHIENFIQ